jgi:hypothetical protein
MAELLTVLLIRGVPSSVRARSTAQDKAPTIQEQIVQMPAGSAVEVKTQAKQKLSGRLGAIAADSFELQTATGGKVQTQSLRFDQVKSLWVKGRLADQGGRTGGAEAPRRLKPAPLRKTLRLLVDFNATNSGQGSTQLASSEPAGFALLI